MKYFLMIFTLVVSTQVFAAKKKATLIVTGTAIVTEESKGNHCQQATLSATKQAFRICDRLVGKRPFGAHKSCQYTEDGRVTQDLVFKCI